MEIIATLVGVIFGWVLTFFSDTLKNIKDDKKKLKVLLFYLLELKYHLQRDIMFKKNIEKLIKALKKKIEESIGETLPDNAQQLPMIRDIIQSMMEKDSNVERIESDLDGKTKEIAEIDPILAYELTGRYNIKSKLIQSNSYFEAVQSQAPEENEINFKEFMESLNYPDELLEDLEDFILELAKKIGRKTKSNVAKKLQIQSDMYSDEEIEVFVTDYLERINNMLIG